MINLSDTIFGIKRKGIIEAVNFDVRGKIGSLIISIELSNPDGSVLNEKSIKQNRIVTYHLLNDNKVNAQFNLVQTGGTGEYDYFFNLLQTVPLPTLILQLATKLNERGIFD